MHLSFGRGCIPFALLALAAPATAQDGAARGVEMFNQCAAITVDAERLACFDRVTREMRAAAAPAIASSTPRTPATPQAQARQQREDFGLDNERVREQRAERVREVRRQQPAKISRITATVAASKLIGPGYWAILFNDGAIWEVRELRDGFEPPRRGQTVTVRRGVMGGYLLYVGKQASIRVQRVS